MLKLRAGDERVLSVSVRLGTKVVTSDNDKLVVGRVARDVSKLNVDKTLRSRVFVKLGSDGLDTVSDSAVGSIAGLASDKLRLGLGMVVSSKAVGSERLVDSSRLPKLGLDRDMFVSELGTETGGAEVLRPGAESVMPGSDTVKDGRPIDVDGGLGRLGSGGSKLAKLRLSRLANIVGIDVGMPDIVGSTSLREGSGTVTERMLNVVRSSKRSVMLSDGSEVGRDDKLTVGILKLKDGIPVGRPVKLSETDGIEIVGVPVESPSVMSSMLDGREVGSEVEARPRSNPLVGTLVMLRGGTSRDSPDVLSEMVGIKMDGTVVVTRPVRSGTLEISKVGRDANIVEGISTLNSLVGRLVTLSDGKPSARLEVLRESDRVDSEGILDGRLAKSSKLESSKVGSVSDVTSTDTEFIGRPVALRDGKVKSSVGNDTEGNSTGVEVSAKGPVKSVSELKSRLEDDELDGNTAFNG